MRTIFFSFSAFFVLVNSLNVAVYCPIFGHSHTIFMGTIADVLSEAGHNVTVVVSIHNKDEYSRTWRRAKTIEMGQDPRQLSLIGGKNGDGGFMKELWTMAPSPLAMLQVSANMTKLFTQQCEYVLQMTKIMEELKKEKFDIGIAEAFEFCGHGIFEMIGVKSIVSVSSAIMFDHIAQMIGVPIVPSYVPGGISECSEKMSLSQRATNALGTIIGSRIFMGTVESQNEVFRRMVKEDFVDLKEIVGASPFVFTNAIPYLDFPHPIIHKVKEIGGITVPKFPSLPKEWDEILARKKENVLISFGSVAKSVHMTRALKENLMATVRNFTGDDLKEIPDNLVLSKWMPQTALLTDPRVSLFVTHGGLGSTIEVASSGTPAIVIPLFADQMRNALVLVRQEVAITITKYDFADEQKFSAAIRKMLGDAKYEKNAKNLASLIRNVPFTPKEILVKNIEFVGKFGNLPQLDPHGRHQSFVQYFLLDIIAFAIFLAISLLLLSSFLLKKFLSLWRIGEKSKSE